MDDGILSERGLVYTKRKSLLLEKQVLSFRRLLLLKTETKIKIPKLLLPKYVDCKELGHIANSAISVQMLKHVASDQGLHCLHTGIFHAKYSKWENISETPKATNGLMKMIKIDKSAGQKKGLKSCW